MPDVPVKCENIRWSECLIVSHKNGPQVATLNSATDAGNLDFYYWHVKA